MSDLPNPPGKRFSSPLRAPLTSDQAPLSFPAAPHCAVAKSIPSRDSPANAVGVGYPLRITHRPSRPPTHAPLRQEEEFALLLGEGTGVGAWWSDGGAHRWDVGSHGAFQIHGLSAPSLNPTPTCSHLGRELNERVSHSDSPAGRRYHIRQGGEGQAAGRAGSPEEVGVGGSKQVGDLRDVEARGGSDGARMPAAHRVPLPVA